MPFLKHLFYIYKKSFEKELPNCPTACFSSGSSKTIWGDLGSWATHYLGCCSSHLKGEISC